MAGRALNDDEVSAEMKVNTNNQPIRLTKTVRPQKMTEFIRQEAQEKAREIQVKVYRVNQQKISAHH
jgi:hypothetical protein